MFEYTLKSFEELSVSELYRIMQLRSRVFVQEQQCLYEDLDNKDQRSLHLMVSRENTIVGYLRIIKPEAGVSDAMAIGRVAVEKSDRGCGLARGMMENALDYIEHVLKEPRVRLSAQVYLKEFYRSLGFVEVSEEYLEDNLPHVDMMLNTAAQ